VIKNYFPANSASLDAASASSLATIPKSPTKTVDKSTNKYHTRTNLRSSLRREGYST
jgi:membrane carboxypeptidase/penicillin-binding protein PbpC